MKSFSFGCGSKKVPKNTLDQKLWSLGVFFLTHGHLATESDMATESFGERSTDSLVLKFFGHTRNNSRDGRCLGSSRRRRNRGRRPL